MTPAWCQRPLRPRRLWPYDAWPLPCAPAEHLHVTLAFLAEVSDRRPDDLVGRVARAATGRTAFPAVVAGGPVPDSGPRPRPLRRFDLTEPARTELSPLATRRRTAAMRAGIAVDAASTR